MISYLSKINGNKGESKVFNMGVTFFVFFSLFDIGRFYQGNEGDSSLMTRFGIFILIVTVVAVLHLGISQYEIRRRLISHYEFTAVHQGWKG